MEKELNLFRAVPIRRTRTNELKWKKIDFIGYKEKFADHLLQKFADTSIIRV